MAAAAVERAIASGRNGKVNYNCEIYVLFCFHLSNLFILKKIEKQRVQFMFLLVEMVVHVVTIVIMMDGN